MGRPMMPRPTKPICMGLLRFDWLVDAGTVHRSRTRLKGWSSSLRGAGRRSNLDRVSELLRCSPKELWGTSMLRFLSLLVVVLLAAPASAQEYQSKELADAAAQYRQELIDSIPAAKKQPALIPRLRRDADAEYRAIRYRQAIAALSQAIASGADELLGG